jgi:hypothetical protein
MNITEKLYKVSDTKYRLTMESDGHLVERNFHIDIESIEDVRRNTRNRLITLLDNLRIIDSESITIEHGEAL